MRYDPEIEIDECLDVYPPKEDTFLLLRNVEVSPGERALEMGCGTGLITCHLSKAGADVTAVDINPKALECTKANASRNDLAIYAVLSDLFAEISGQFDLIVFNPPYLSVEEDGLIERSWAGGADGVRVLERFLEQSRDHLRPGGRIMLLLSSEMSDASLTTAMSAYDREKLASERYFFEELWVEKLTIR